MIADANPHLVRMFRAVSRVAGLAVLSVGCLVLVGWIFDISALRGVLPGFATMKFNTALCFALAGIALLLQWQSERRWARRLVQMCAIAVALVGLVTFMEYLFGWDLGIDRWVVREPAVSFEAIYPGRMAPNTALIFVLLGCGLCLFMYSHGYRVAQGLVWVATLLSLLAIIGYFYGVEALYRISIYTSIAPTTAATFLVLCLGILLARPVRGLLTIIISPGVGGVMARRLLPVSVLLPLLMGWFALQGINFGHFDAAFSTSVVALSSVVIFTGLIWLNASSIHGMDETLRKSHDELEMRVQARTAELKAVNLNLESEVLHRQQAENVLAEERNLLRTLIDHLPDAIYFKDTRGRILIDNIQNRRNLGATEPDGSIGKTDFDFHPPELAEQFFALEQEVMRTGKPLVDQEELNIDPQGNHGWHASTKVPLQDAQGKVIGLVGISRDITERRRAVDALDNERRLLRTLIDNLPDYIFIKDLAGRFVISNLAHARAARMSPDDLVGKTAYEVFPSEFAMQFHTDDLTIMQTGQPMINLERTTVDENGNQRAVLTTKVPMRDGSGNVVGLVGISRDISARRQVEQALRNSETRLAGILETAHEAIISVDEEQHIILYNTGAELAFGYTRDDAIGQPLDLLLPTWAQAIHRLYVADFAGGVTMARQMSGDSEVYGRRKDGHEFPLEASISKLNIEGHSFLTVVLRDITERKEAEKALRKSEAAEREQRILAETLRDTALALTSKLEPDAVINNILINIDRVVPHDSADIMLIDGNTVRLAASHGYPPESVPALKGLTFPLTVRNISEMLLKHIPVVIPDTAAEPGWITVPGSEWIRSSVGAPVEVRGKVMGFLNLNSAKPEFFTPAHAADLHTFASQAGIALDNARLVEELQRYTNELERRVDERTFELQQAKDDIEAILNHTSDAILVVKADGTIRQVNPTFSELFGYMPDKALGQPLTKLAPTDYVKQLADAVGSVITGGSARRTEIEAARQDGTLFSADIGLAPIPRRGEIVCSIRDITERKKVERELQELSQLKTEFLSTAAHELRTPLTSILGFSELLLTRNLEADRGRHYQQLIYEQSIQLQKIVNALLDISRLEAKQKLALDLRSVNMKNLVTNALTAFTESSPSHRFQIEGLSACPSIIGDPFRVNQVLQNLLSNAIKYSPQGGTVTVRGKVVPGFVEISVQDEGIGMTAQQQTHLFERFYRADTSNTTISGTGLGLAISRLIVELHGGSIWVESEHNVGTSVYFTLPLSSMQGDSIDNQSQHF